SGGVVLADEDAAVDLARERVGVLDIEAQRDRARAARLAGRPRHVGSIDNIDRRALDRARQYLADMRLDGGRDAGQVVEPDGLEPGFAGTWLGEVELAVAVVEHGIVAARRLGSGKGFGLRPGRRLARVALAEPRLELALGHLDDVADALATLPVREGALVGGDGSGFVGVAEHHLVLVERPGIKIKLVDDEQPVAIPVAADEQGRK